MLRFLALRLIRFYQRHLSALKGWRCAHGQLHGHGTCSSIGLRYFQKTDFVRALLLLRRQFDRCSLAARQIRQAQTPARSFPSSLSGPARQQAGFVDCDCSGCDLPAPDCPSLSCDAPTAADCGLDLAWLGCDSLNACNACDSSLDCFGSGGSEDRSRKAERRERRRENRRRERRGEPPLPDSDDPASPSSTST